MLFGDQIKKMRLVGHVARMRRDVCRVLVGGNLRKRDHLGDAGIDGRIILRWIFRMWDVGVWTGSSWLRIGTGGEHLSSFSRRTAAWTK
jgi:hypothetical protein